MTFARTVTLASASRSASRACRIKIRIAPAYTWLCQFVQALLAVGLIKINHEGWIMRKKIHHLKICAFAAPFKRLKLRPQIVIQRLLQKTGSDAFSIFFWMAMNQVCDLEDCDLNDVSRPWASPTDRRLFFAGALALPLADVLANVELSKAQAAKGVSINQTTVNSRSVSTYFAKPDKKDAPVFF